MFFFEKKVDQITGRTFGRFARNATMRLIVGWRENGAGTHTMSATIEAHIHPWPNGLRLIMQKVEDGRSPQIDFTELRISDLNHRKSKRIAPDEPMFRIYFWLSAEPNTSWRKLFELVRRESSHSLRAKARVDGRNIVIECPLSEIEAQKAELDADVANANYEYSRCGDFWPTGGYKKPEQEREDRRLLREIGRKLGYGDQG